MSLTKTEAIARARAAKAKFPKGKITEAQARQMFVSIMESLVGYSSGNPNYSFFGEGDTWSTRWNGRQVYWCVLTGSWAADFAFGTEAAKAGFGKQYPGASYPPAGGTWTVWVLNQARLEGRIVPFDQQKPGDICLTDWDRVPLAPVDHYDVVVAKPSGNYANVIGGNTSSGNASAGAGVYRAQRPRARVVAIVRPNYKALVETYNKNIVEEDELSAAEVKEIKAYIDSKNQETLDRIDKLRSERTNAHVETKDKLSAISKVVQQHTTQLNTVGRIAREAREHAKNLPAALISTRVPFQPGTSLHKLFGKDFRLGALLGYAGAAFVDRDTHTEEIVDALEDLQIPEVTNTEFEEEV